MSLAATTGSVSGITQWLRGLWEFYREYTHTAIHAAAAAALTAFGLLVFVDPLFVVLAIASYVGPPLVLYGIGADVGTATGPSSEAPVRTESGANSGGHSDTGERDGDTDGDEGDTDSDGDDGDTDSDGRDADADAADADG